MPMQHHALTRQDATRTHAAAIVDAHWHAAIAVVHRPLRTRQQQVIWPDTRSRSLPYSCPCSNSTSDLIPWTRSCTKGPWLSRQAHGKPVRRRAIDRHIWVSRGAWKAGQHKHGAKAQQYC